MKTSERKIFSGIAHDDALVSVLIPAYNSERYLAAAIESVLSQTYTDWELIIVDDGSSDATSDIAADYVNRDARIKLIRQSNSGLAQTRNRAFEASVGSYVALLDSDDVFHSDKLSKQVALLNQYPEVNVVFGDVLWADSNMNGGTLLRVPLGEGACDVFNNLAVSNLFPVHAALVRRSSINQTGRLHDAERVQLEDWSLWTRLAEKGLFYYHADVVGWYRQHSQMSRRVYGGRRQYAERLRTVHRICNLPRFREMPASVRAQACFNQGRFAVSHNLPKTARRWYLKALSLSPFDVRCMVAYMVSFLGK